MGRGTGSTSSPEVVALPQRGRTSPGLAGAVGRPALGHAFDLGVLGAGEMLGRVDELTGAEIQRLERVLNNLAPVVGLEQMFRIVTLPDREGRHLSYLTGDEAVVFEPRDVNAPLRLASTLQRIAGVEAPASS